MGECFKAGFTMIAAHATVSHTAKRQMGIGKMNDRIIDTAGAE